MAVQVETLNKLERRITITLAASEIDTEIQSRLRKLASDRKRRIDGFRPGKVPVSVMQKLYGPSVHYEVMNDKLGDAFSQAAKEAQLNVAGTPSIAPNPEAPEGQLAFDATFEVYPEVSIGDLSQVPVDRIAANVDDAAIDKTVDILRKQRRNFVARDEGQYAEETDRVTIDFEGKIDGEPFDGGKAEAFQFIIGEGQMLAQFDQAVRGMRVGDSKTFALQFPEDYQGRDVAGKEADFLVTMKAIEWQQLPDVNAEFAQALGIADGTVEALRADVKKNLEREVKFRVQARNKSGVMDALLRAVEIDVPKALVDGEIDRLMQQARVDLKSRGMKEADTVDLPRDVFQAQAERRVKLGLVVAELVRSQNLQVKPGQLQTHIEELAQSYEQPSEVVRWYLSDRQRMAEIEAMVIENNVAEYVLGHAAINDRTLPFDELMTAN